MIRVKLIYKTSLVVGLILLLSHGVGLAQLTTATPTATPTVPQQIGAPCVSYGQCLSSHCVDGACCVVAQCPSGESCNISGSVGNCFPLPTPTDTPTPTTAQVVRVITGSGRGGLGDAVPITVSLSTSGVSVAATTNTISFDSTALSIDVSTCHLAPGLMQIGKVLVVSAVVSGTRFVVESTQNTNPIPPGPLYACTFDISTSALPIAYTLQSFDVSAFGAAGTELPYVSGVSGSITVSFVPSACAGDCNGDGVVSIDEILTLVNIALGHVRLKDCEAGDVNVDGRVTVDEILTAVNDGLSGCP
jgi:hypothetical protein